MLVYCVHIAESCSSALLIPTLTYASVAVESMFLVIAGRALFRVSQRQLRSIERGDGMMWTWGGLTYTPPFHPH